MNQFVQVPVEVIQMRLTASQLATYLALQSFADGDGFCYPKQATIAERAGISRPSVERAVKRLRELGLIKTDPWDVGGQRIGLYYWMLNKTSSEVPSKTREVPSEMMGGPITGEGRVPSPVMEQELEPVNKNQGRTTSAAQAPPNEGETFVAKVAEKRKGCRLPSDFQVTTDMVNWSRKECPGVDGRHETAQFVDYWNAKSGQAATKLDWTATWRNWMRNAQHRLPAHKATARRSSTFTDPTTGYLIER